MRQFGFTTREIAITAIFTAITAILAPITIPLTPIPFSLGLFGVFFAATILPTKLSVTSQVTYLLLGGFGLPIFTNYTGGPQKLIGPTGGYLIGYVFMALVMGLLHARKPDCGFGEAIAVSSCGLAICYFFGAGWMAVSMGLSLKQSLLMGVVPFIPFDGVKIVIASAVGLRVRKALRQASLITS